MKCPKCKSEIPNKIGSRDKAPDKSADVTKPITPEASLRADDLPGRARNLGDEGRAEEFMQKAQTVCERAGLEPDALVVLPFLD